jgi:hypothetical protein
MAELIEVELDAAVPAPPPGAAGRGAGEERREELAEVARERIEAVLDSLDDLAGPAAAAETTGTAAAPAATAEPAGRRHRIALTPGR